MSHMKPNVARSGHSTSVDRGRDERTTDVDLALSLLRKAVHDCRWTLDALAAHMHIDKGYISRVMNGEKPLTLVFEVGLPDDVEARYKQYRAESLGLIVVEQMDDDSARRAFAAGLFNMLTAKRDVLTMRMAKAAIQEPRKSVSA